MPISVREDRPLDPSLARILASVDAVASTHDTAYLLSGAMAREILLVHVHGLPPGRATRDVDFGVMVQSWADFSAFKEALVSSGHFTEDTAIHHRLYALPEHFGVRMMVDLVPFGPIEAPPGSVAWPPDGEVIMDVRGFQLGLQSAMQVEVQPGLTIPIPRIEAMLIMKALAWRDRGLSTQGRDAIDLLDLLERGEDIIGLDTLYEHHLEAIERYGGDPRLAGAEVLGSMAKNCMSEPLAEEVRGILGQGLGGNLVVQVMGGRGGLGGSSRFEALEATVRAFLKGIGNP
ncbi:MAG: hypothetical protein H6Q00_2239 [Holophagaceae bacterium]|nr:hypothetical protein [Holophagaceae bacterium]